MDTKKTQLTPYNVLNQEYTSIEETHLESCKKLGWGKHLDVLYSFKGIFSYGIYILDKDKSNKYTIGRDGVIRIKNMGGQQLSRKYVVAHFNEYKKVAELTQEFAEVYTSIGNVFPIWPGGNAYKGVSGCNDIPDIFFRNEENKQMELVYIQHILNKKNGFTDIMLNNIIESPKVNSISSFLRFNQEEYEEFLKKIVSEINSRTEKIREKLKEV